MPTKQQHPLFFAAAAIVIWASLATLGTRVAAVPPFLTVGITLLVAGVLSLPTYRQWKVPLPTLLVGIAGIFGYHFFLFLAFRLAPAVEANLLNYLWPLLIVLLSPVLLPNMALRRQHIVAAGLGFIGAALIVTKGSLSLEARFITGYACAVLAAFLWAAYSLLSKRLPPYPTAVIGLFCLLSGGLSLLSHFALEPAYTPKMQEWIWLGLLGIGPMGGAFFLWDKALKQGDPRKIGALAFTTPLLSTLLLIVTGSGVLDGYALAAIVLIVGGAVLGTRTPK